MTFRLRLTLLASLAVAVAIAGTSVIVYYTYRAELMRQVDKDLSSSESIPALKAALAGLPPAKLRAQRRKQVIVSASGAALSVQVRGPGIGGDVGYASTAVGGRFATETVDGVRSRVLVLNLPGGQAQIVRSLVDVDRSLTHLRFLLAFISVAGIGAAAALGAVVSGAALGPLRRLTERTERIVETGDLSERVGQPGRDEISRLSGHLDELLATLETSVGAQRQLVADASHELRTPLATLRANVELLAGHTTTLEPAERAEIVSDVRDELEQMSDLVAELVELARGEEREVARCDFRLDEVVRAAVERARRRAPALTFRTELAAVTVTGVPERAERAVANLLDNARKWSPPGGTIDVAVHDGSVVVRDEGAGVDPEDAPLIFNRFYRSAGARGMPGAGLGLSIVKQIAEAHGGSVTLDRAPEGGAIFRLQLSPSR